jgi:hypothetical protein
MTCGPAVDGAPEWTICAQAANSAAPSDAAPGLTGDQRWQQLSHCLTGTTMPLTARAAGASTLLYCAAVSHILTLRTRDVVTINGRCHIHLGEHPVLLPPALASLIGQQLAAAAARPAAPDGSHWLFPGATGIRPLTRIR